MQLEVSRHFGSRIGAPVLNSTYQIPFDPTAADRASDLIDGLFLENFHPRRIVAGLRAFMSLYATVNNMGDRLALVVSPSSVFAEEHPVRFRDIEIELDMTTENEDDLRVTCGLHGLAFAVARMPDTPEAG